MYDSCLLALRALEKELACTCRADARTRRLANPQLIFSDIRQPGPERVDLLIRPLQAKLVQVDHEDRCLQCDRTVELDCSAPLYSEVSSTEIIHVEDEWVWAESTDNFAPGYLCTQTKLTGDLEDLFHEFQSTWSKRWQRHADILTSQWKDILEFARHHAPPIPCSSPSLNAQSLANEIKRKKTRTARGLDGVKQTSRCQTQFVSDFVIFSSLQKPMENGPSSSQRAEWPHWRSAHHPQEPLDFRPITVLSLRRTIPGI